MGYNTVVLVLNDAASQIRDHAQDFADSVTLGYGAHVRQEKHSDRWPDGIGTTPAEYLSIGNHCNAATVITCNHSSETAVLLVGGNYATVLGVAHGPEHHKRDSVKRLLNDVLAEHGLQVIEKRTKR